MARCSPTRTAAPARPCHSGQVAAGARAKARRPEPGRGAAGGALERTPESAAGRLRAAYLTRIVLVADVFLSPPYVTRTRSLYLPLADGAFHLRL